MAAKKNKEQSAQTNNHDNNDNNDNNDNYQHQQQRIMMNMMSQQGQPSSSTGARDGQNYGENNASSFLNLQYGAIESNAVEREDLTRDNEFVNPWLVLKTNAVEEQGQNNNSSHHHHHHHSNQQRQQSYASDTNHYQQQNNVVATNVVAPMAMTTTTTNNDFNNNNNNAVAQQIPPAAMLPKMDAQHRDQLRLFWQQQMSEVESATDFKNHQLPLARIKKIMKTDEDVRMISSEAPVLFAKACEMFILELTLRSWIHSEENKRRTLQRNDIATAITKTDIFDFLVDIVPRDEVVGVGASSGAALAAEAAAAAAAAAGFVTTTTTTAAAAAVEDNTTIAAAAAAAAASNDNNAQRQQQQHQLGEGDIYY
jgi:histone H3/H4